ncbi:hypothetical protein BBJ28_00020447 [Nothophytophthora sp. Chile5]|nr:hypothetical protein BBJ28_00020447 [Nothophytophthora sp. Chile5]
MQMLPWTLALHLGFSVWMYSNPKLMEAHMLDLPWVLEAIGLSPVVESTKRLRQMDIVSRELQATENPGRVGRSPARLSKCVAWPSP